MVLNFIPRTAVANVLQKQHLMVGLEKFYLKVGRLLHKKSAQVGLVKDGVVKASSSPSASSTVVYEANQEGGIKKLQNSRIFYFSISDDSVHGYQ